MPLSMEVTTAASFCDTSRCVLPVMVRCTCLPVPGSRPAVYRASHHSYFLPVFLSTLVFFLMLPMPRAFLPAMVKKLLSKTAPVCYNRHTETLHLLCVVFLLSRLWPLSTGGIFLYL